MLMRLGGYNFVWNPDTVTIPEMKKSVSRLETYQGSAIFQWASFLEGTTVELWWEWLSEAQYEALRNQYLSLDPRKWIASQTEAFIVYVTNLGGKYIETGLDEFPYRMDVQMTLDLRSTTSAVTTTSTTA